MTEWILSVILSLVVAGSIFIFAWWAINTLCDAITRRVNRLIHGRR